MNKNIPNQNDSQPAPTFVNWTTGLLTASALMVCNLADAQNFTPPAPSASASQIFNLAGTAIPGNNVVEDYSASFVADSTESTVTFLFRHDPGFFTFNNASVADANTPSQNLLLNGNFTDGAPTAPGGGAPDWTYFQQAGVTFLGYELAGGSWFDGSTGGYDGIDQSFATVVGDTYDVTFTLEQEGALGDPTYQETSNNGHSGTMGNGIDMLVYAGNGLPPTGTVPEPATYVAGILMLIPIGIRTVRSFCKNRRA